MTTAKPTVDELGVDVDAQHWLRSGEGEGAIEVAFVRSRAVTGRSTESTGDDEWVLMRVAGDPSGRVLVYDRHEWECFLDGVKRGEFDDAVT